MINNKKRVCLLIYNLGSGGAEHVISQWSLLLSEQYEIYMTVFDGDTIPNYEYYGKLHNLNVKSNNSSYIKKIITVLKRADALKKFVKMNRIDLVLSFCNECNLVNTISNHGAKKACSIRSVSDLKANPFVKYVIKSKKNNLIVQTKTLKDMLIQQYGIFLEKKTVIFGNPFNTSLIRKMSLEFPPKQLSLILQEKTTIVNVASIKESKNHVNLLRTFELVCEKKPDTYLLLVGADPVGKGDKIKKMAEESKYSNQIIFAGEMKNPFSIVSRSTLFVLPSLAEGIPNALAEAMICGVPVIASNCPTGPQELLTNNGEKVEYNEKGYAVCRYGILVRPFTRATDANYDYSAENHYFANAILDVLESSKMYDDIKKRSLEGAEKFDLGKYKKALINLIDTLF